MSEQPIIKIKQLPHGEGLDLPNYASSGAAGMDLCAALSADDSLIIEPGARKTVPTGFAVSLPQGFEAQVRPRSGLAAKHGLTVLNTPGTIDSDYRGEVKIILVNLGDKPIPIKRDMRIAQMVVANVAQVTLEQVDALDNTARGRRGFGSTGVGATSR